MSEPLKPCPFCGGLARNYGTKWVACGHVSGCPGNGFIAEPEEWNRRAPRFTKEEQAFWDAAKAYISHAIFGIEELPVIVEVDAMRERHRLYGAMVEAYRAMLAEGGREQ